MATPTVTATLHKSSFVSGEPMLLTVLYGHPDGHPVTVTVVLTDAAGRSSAPVSVTTGFEPLTVTVTDDSGRVWSRLSDDGATAVHQAVA
ncbi:hypothetical protein E1091_09985 [Micromonospora fluostatini]|uniref:Uncharacterized protein n=1 Tax=Micromonospora fluostatini TaxID=1629071 RepID=A0ABY2DK43_9ACTN|nr:hypothetical protein E1091_09985 [Micromonospora fluostatini]